MHKPFLTNRLGRWLAVAAFGLLAAPAAQAQLAGAKAIPGDYATVAAAITDLNTQGVGAGGVTFNIAAGYTETFASPTAGAITATGTAANPITFQKAGTGANPRITAGVGTTIGLDAIIALIGSDYVTLDGLDLAESAANTTATAQMEFGVALFRASATDGSQNNTVRNCVVTLIKTNANTIGIYGAPSGATATTAVPATAATGANSGNKVYGNVISNSLIGIYFAAGSATTFANYDQNNEIGSVVSPATTPTGNTIGNFGGSASGYGAGGTYQTGLKIQGNTINSTLNYTSATASTSVAASTVTSTLRGIYTTGGSSQTLDITNNTITLASGGTTAQLSGVENTMGGTAAGSAVTITGNTLSITYTTATSATVYGFYNSASPATVTISNNTLNATTLSNTGSTYLIYNNHSATAATVANNRISGVSRTGASGSVYGYFNNGSGAGTQSLTGNVFNNISVAGSSTFYGLYNTSSSSETQLWSGNQITNITTATGTSYGVYDTYGNTGSQFFNNTVTGLVGGGTLYGIYLSTSSLVTAAVYGNTVASLSSSGAASTVYGIYTATVTTPSVYRNKVYDLSASGATATVYGLYNTGGTTILYHNNLVGDLRATASTNLNAVVGLYINSGTTVNAYYNTIYLNASSTGATFGTSGLHLNSTAATLDLRNNIVINKSTAAGTGGYTAAFRRVSGTAGTPPANLASTSNNNLYYAGTPAATNLIYVEGTTTTTNASQTVAAYKALVSARESFSQSEDVAFLSTTGTAATFLHINPAVPTLVEGKAQPISGLTVDFDNDTRSATTPDIGADEGTFIVGGAPVDLAATGLIAPSTTGCYGATESVIVSVRNNGTQALNFGVNPATVTVNVTGAVTQTLTATVNTGTLAVGASQNVTLLGTLNMSAAGTYIFAITATATGDGDTSNDNLTASRTKVAIATGPQQLNFTGFTGANLSTLYPGWYEATGLTLPTGTASTWTSDDYANVVNGPNGISAKINLFSNTRNDWMVSPRVLATASSVLTYELAMTTFATTTAGTLGSDDRLEVRVSTDCGVSFTTIKSYTAATPISATGQFENISLASYAGQEIIVAFFATEGTVDDTNDNDVFIDNISLNPQGVDLAATALVSPTTGQGCYSTAENVVVSVRNTGAQTIDFSVNPATVTVSVTGAVTQTLTATVNTGTLAVGASQNVTLAPALNMTTAGTYTFAITATVTGDQNTTNDVLTPNATRTVVAPVAGTLTASTSSLCVSGTATLTLTGSANGTIQWQQSTDNVTFTDISGANAATYTTPVLTSTTYFRARTTCNTTVATSNVATITVSNPQATTTNSPVAICAGGTATLTATAATGTTVQFFENATGGTALPSTGGTFTTPALTTSRQYFVEATSGGQESVGRPAPTSVSSTTASTYGLVFNAASTFTLTSVDVYPTGAAGNLVVQVQDNAGTLIPGLTATVAVPAGTSAGNVPFTVPLNFSVPAGVGLRLIAISSPSLVRESSVGGFPYTSPSGAVSITNGYITGTTTTYYYFYNWQISTACTGTRTAIQVNVTPAATASFPAATAASCGASPYQLAGTVGGSATAGTYTSSGTGTFSPNATTLNATYTPSAADVAAGSVTITLTSTATGTCPAATATLALSLSPAPVATFTYPTATTYCAGSTSTVTPTLGTGASAGVFSSTTGLTLNATTGVISLATSTAGTYTVTNTIAASGTCAAASATTTVTITPAASAAFAYPSATFCVSGTTAPAATVTGTTGGTFTSTTGLTLNATTGAITLASSTPGTYTVTYTVAGPCGASSTQAVTITAAPTATFSYATASACAGSATLLTPTLGTGATAGTFSSTTGLSLNATTGAVNPATSTAGTYTVTNTVAATGGCAAATSTATVTINALPATPTYTYTYPTRSTVLFTSSAAPAGTTYQWYLGNNPIAGATNQTYTANGVTAPGNYTVRFVSTATGCQSAASTPLTVTAAGQALAGSSLTLFPNPTADGKVTLQLNGYAKAVKLTIIDALGRVVLTQQVAAGQTEATLDLSGAASGVYTLRAVTEGGTDVRRIVRE